MSFSRSSGIANNVSASFSPYTTSVNSTPVPLCESNIFVTKSGINVGSPRYLGMLQTAKVVFAEEGIKGFFRGIIPRVFVHAPSVAISWTTYESIKYLFGSKPKPEGETW